MSRRVFSDVDEQDMDVDDEEDTPPTDDPSKKRLCKRLYDAIMISDEDYNKNPNHPLLLSSSECQQLFFSMYQHMTTMYLETHQDEVKHIIKGICDDQNDEEMQHAVRHGFLPLVRTDEQGEPVINMIGQGYSINRDSLMQFVRDSNLVYPYLYVLPAEFREGVFPKHQHQVFDCLDPHSRPARAFRFLSLLHPSIAYFGKLNNCTWNTFGSEEVAEEIVLCISLSAFADEVSFLETTSDPDRNFLSQQEGGQEQSLIRSGNSSLSSVFDVPCESFSIETLIDVMRYARTPEGIQETYQMRHLPLPPGDIETLDKHEIDALLIESYSNRGGSISSIRLGDNNPTMSVRNWSGDDPPPPPSRAPPNYRAMDQERINRGLIVPSMYLYK